MKERSVFCLVAFIPLILSSALAAENDLRFTLEDFEGIYRFTSGYGDVPSGWTPAGSKNGEFSKNTNGHHGSYCLHAYITNDLDYYTVLERTFSSQPGRQLNLRIQVRGLTTDKAEAALDATYFVGNTKHFYESVFYWYSSSSMEWRTITLKTYEVPPNGEMTIRLRMHHNSPSGYTSFDWDCLTFDYIPQISISPSSLEFSESVRIGESVRKRFAVTNAGSGDLVIGAISISGSNATEFHLENDNCSGETISPSQTKTFEVRFTPLSGGRKTAKVEIPSNDLENPTLTVAVSGLVSVRAMPGILILLGDEN